MGEMEAGRVARFSRAICRVNLNKVKLVVIRAAAFVDTLWARVEMRVCSSLFPATPALVIMYSASASSEW